MTRGENCLRWRLSARFTLWRPSEWGEILPGTPPHDEPSHQADEKQGPGVAGATSRDSPTVAGSTRDTGIDALVDDWVCPADGVFVDTARVYGLGAPDTLLAGVSVGVAVGGWVRAVPVGCALDAGSRLLVTGLQPVTAAGVDNPDTVVATFCVREGEPIVDVRFASDRAEGPLHPDAVVRRGRGVDSVAAYLSAAGHLGRRGSPIRPIPLSADRAAFHSGLRTLHEHEGPWPYASQRDFGHSQPPSIPTSSRALTRSSSSNISPTGEGGDFSLADYGEFW